MSGRPGSAWFRHLVAEQSYLPNLVDLAHDINMHAASVAAGPGIRHRDPIAGARKST